MISFFIIPQNFVRDKGACKNYRCARDFRRGRFQTRKCNQVQCRCIDPPYALDKRLHQKVIHYQGREGVILSTQVSNIHNSEN